MSSLSTKNNIADEIGLANLVNFLNMEQNELTEGHRRDYLNL